jgi:hypothetical protein
MHSSWIDVKTPPPSPRSIVVPDSRISTTKLFRIWDSHSGGYEDYNLLGYNACSPLKVYQRFGKTHRLHLQGRKYKFSKKLACHLLSRWFLAKLIFSTLKMEAICSSETSVDTRRTTRRYIAGKCTLQQNYFLQQLCSFVFEGAGFISRLGYSLS